MLLFSESTCFKKTLCRNQDSEVQVPCIRLYAHLSSIIRPDDEHFFSGLQYVSKSFETVPSCICPDISATRPDTLQCSTSKMISFQNTNMGRQLQTVLMSGLHRPNAILDKASHAKDVQPSRRQSTLFGRSDLIMKIACCRSATVRTLGQHRPDAALFRKE
jgi:hypothetical protein